MTPRTLKFFKAIAATLILIGSSRIFLDSSTFAYDILGYIVLSGFLLYLGSCFFIRQIKNGGLSSL